MNDALKVFVVEDDPIISLDVRETLTDSGYLVVGHTDTAEIALEEIPKVMPDLVLMDVNIKGKKDGIEVASVLNQDHNIPLIFLTALSDEETLSRATLTKPFGYIVKPFSEADLVSTIEVARSRFNQPIPEKASDIDDFLPAFQDIDQDTKLDIEKLSCLQIFSKLELSKKEELLIVSNIKSFSAGDLVLSHEARDFGFVVLTGRIGIVSTSIAGKDLITTLLGPGDAYGIFFALHGFSDKLYAKAQAESKVLVIPSAYLQRLQIESIEYTQELISELSFQLTRSVKLAQALAFSKVEGRIVNALLALLPSFGKKVASGNNAGRLFITRKELAEFTGTTPETAIRVTKALERSGLLDLSKPGIIKIIEIDSLKNMSYE